MAPRLKDIAFAANVDIGTVSHVLNDRPKAALLRPETRERIRQIAEKMGYCRDEFAASVVKKSGKVLAFVSYDMGGIEYTGRIQNGVLDEAAAHDYAVTTYRLTGNNQDEILRKLKGWRAAGAVFHIPKLDGIQKIIEELNKASIPYGTVNLSNPGGIGVTSDDLQGEEEAVKYLVEQGCCKVAFVLQAREDDSEYVKARIAGYRRGLEKYLPGCPEEFIPLACDLQGLVDPVEVRRAVKAFERKKIDGAVCISDHYAFQLLQAQMAKPFVKVVGFGDLLAKYCIPILPTVSQNFEEMGRKCVRLVLEAIGTGKIPEHGNILLPTRLIVSSRDVHIKKRREEK